MSNLSHPSIMNRPAPLMRRFAALLYEALLVGAVSAVAGLAAGIANTLIVRLLPAATALTVPLTGLLLLAGWWYYFKLNWLREGQTLPMRVWQIGLADARSGGRPTLNQYRRRFAAAVALLVVLPLAAYAGLRRSGIPPKTAAAAALCWWILPWGFALLNHRHQFLYDYWAGTELTDLRDGARQEAGK